MTNKFNKVLYIGATNNIEERVKEHKLQVYPDCFTAKYNCNKLVYLEERNSAQTVSKRERQMKKWKREWKINLIHDMNPAWFDLSTNWNLDFNRLRNEQR